MYIVFYVYYEHKNEWLLYVESLFIQEKPCFCPNVVVHAYNPSSKVTEIRVLQVEGQPMAKMEKGLLQVALDCHMHCDLWSSLPTEMNKQTLRNL